MRRNGWRNVKVIFESENNGWQNEAAVMAGLKIIVNRNGIEEKWRQSSS